MALPASVALLGAASLVSAGHASLPRHLATRDNSSLTSCFTAANLVTVTSSNADWANDSAAYNERLPYQPAVIVYPGSAQDVSAAVKCAAASNLSVNARSGGHSYAAFGLGGEDGHVVVSLDSLDDITLNADNTVAIGAGNRLGDVALGIWEQGERAMAHGTCPYVGIGGHAGHGGFGLSSRGWGTVMDQVYEVEVVTADGSILTANNETNSDLFWALRGAASSFGIVTEFKAVTHAPPAHNVWFTYSWSNLSSSQASDFMQMWQSFAATLPAGFGFQIHINPQTNTTPGFVVDGYLYSDDDDAVATANSTIKVLLDQYGISPDAVQVEDQTWIEQIDFLAGVDAASKLNTTLGPDTLDTFYATSIYVTEEAPMTQTASDAFMEYLWTTATEANDNVAWYLIFDLWGGNASVIRNAGLDATAFDSRDALYSIQLWGQSPSGSPPFPANGISVVHGMVTAITDNQPETQWKGYMNYVDSELSREEAWAYYFPTHTAQLQTLKAKYDPADLFSFPQSFTGTTAQSGSSKRSSRTWRA